MNININNKKMLNENKSDSTNVNIVNNYCKYLNKKVLLKTLKSSHLGSLKCIDPLTQSVALIVDDMNSKVSKVVIAMSHSIKSIELMDESNDDDNSDDLTIDLHQFLSTSMGDKLKNTYSDQQLSERKSEVISWLRKNHIPVQEAEDGSHSLIIAYAVTLTVPYFKEHCICANELVLAKIQSILDSMPTKSD